MKSLRCLCSLLFVVSCLCAASCSTVDPLGKFQESAAAVRDRYDVSLGVVPVPQASGGWAVAGPFIVRPRVLDQETAGAKSVVELDNLGSNLETP